MRGTLALNGLIIDSLNKINKKKRAEYIATYDFSTLYTKVPLVKLLDELSSTVDFAFYGRKKSYIQISTIQKVFEGYKV